MKKDPFNGKIKKEHVATTLFSIIFGAVIFLACAILFLCVGLFYDNVDENARPLMYAVSVICFVFSVAFPVAAVVSVRTYPKHKMLAHLLLKEYLFVKITDDNEANQD